MTRLFVESIGALVVFEPFTRWEGISRLATELTKPRKCWRRRKFSSEEVNRAVDIACVLYFRQVSCLHRSAVVSYLLSKYGYPSELVIGAQVLRSRYHAWVELDKVVVNDKEYVTTQYIELDRISVMAGCV